MLKRSDSINQIDIDKHVAAEHYQSPFSVYLREIVYGGLDGIVTTFAVVAGFSGAQISANITTIPVLSVLLFGFANLLADATSMGLGNFLSVRADQDVYTREEAKERQEIKNNTEFEKLETVSILQTKGFLKMMLKNSQLF
jgi:vacuolar iron transporter family protein